MDLSLLDVITGYFGRMDLATAAVKSFPFVRDLAQCAHAAVARSHALQLPTTRGNIAPQGSAPADPHGAYEPTRPFVIPITTEPGVGYDMGVMADATSMHDDLTQGVSQLSDLDFGGQDFLFGLMETDLSWGLLSAVPSADILPTAKEP